jgi:hypothetical protein
MITAFNAEIDNRVRTQRNQYRAFWDSPVTPDAILEQWGQRGTMMLAAAGENVEHLTKLAAFVGKTLSDIIDLSFVIPRREFVPHEDGKVTLEPPAEGYDAWGREIVEPEPIEEPEPEPEP